MRRGFGDSDRFEASELNRRMNGLVDEGPGVLELNTSLSMNIRDAEYLT